MAKICTSMEQLIGGTPLLRLTNTEKKLGLEAVLLAKLESFNPAGSVKDRAAKAMIDDAEKRGLLQPGALIIEPTSGNTGIGLAAIAAARGYRAVLVMPDTMSVERRTLLRAFGAEIVLTDGAKGMAGAIEKAEQIAVENPGSFLPGQFTNPSGAAAHFETTGPELYADTDGKIDIFVCGIGSGGTVTGVGAYLKSKNPAIRIVGVEPEKSAVLSGGSAGVHGIQGIGAGFVPQVLRTELLDEVLTVSDEEALEEARGIGVCEGFLVGISSGAAAAAAIRLAKRPENRGKTIVTVFPDSGDRYLSTRLYRAQEEVKE